MNKNISEIVERIRKIKNLPSDAQVANLLGTTRGNLSNHKRKGTVPLDKVLSFCEREGFSVEYILYGIGTPHLHRHAEMPGQQGIPPNTTQLPSSVSDPDIKFSLLLAKTMNILKSGTKYARGLESSIEVFDSAVNDIKELETTKQNVEDLRSRVSQLETTLSDEKEKSSGGEEH